MELRDYQKECIEVLDTDGAVGSHLVAMATGLGKTVVFAHLKRRGRTLILSHRDELVHQPLKHFDGQCSIGIEKAESYSQGEDIVSASIQSLSRDSRLSRFSPDDFYTIIIDECHHAAAPSYRKVLDYFSGAKQVLGFTATPKRGDGVRLTDVFDDIIFTRDLKWGIENGWLSGIRSMRVKAEFRLQGTLKTAGDFNAKDLDRRIGDKAYVAAAKAYVQECHAKNRHTLIYCVTVKACENLCAMIRGLLPPSEAGTVAVLTGKTLSDERASMLKDFSEGKIKCIINCMVLTEGTDLPVCDTVVNLRPTCNISLYSQMVGRACRLYKEKDYAMVIDIIPDDERKLRNLCTAPVLFGIDPARLSKKNAARITEDTDLLDLCNELQENSAAAINLAKWVDISIKEAESFLQSRMEIIKGDGSPGQRSFIAAVDRYNDFVSGDPDTESGLDFGPVFAEILPEEDRRYLVRAGWEGRIYISQPDLLGNVTAEFIVPHEIGPNGLVPSTVRRYIGQMHGKDAVELVKAYCQLVPQYQQHTWKKDVRDSWRNIPATPSQQNRLRHTYERYGFTGDGLDTVSKLDAGSLIDLDNQVKEYQKEEKRYKAYQKGIKHGDNDEELAAEYRKHLTEIKGLPLLPFKEAVENGIQENAGEDKGNLPPYAQTHEVYNGTDREKRLKILLETGKFSLQIPERKGSNKYRATENQKNYISSLAIQLSRMGYLIDYAGLLRMATAMDASFLIALMKKIKDGYPDTRQKILFSEDSLIAASALFKYMQEGDILYVKIKTAK